MTPLDGLLYRSRWLTGPLTLCLLLDAHAQSTPPSPGAAPEEIVITSSRIETPLRQVGTSMSVITREEIEMRGYAAIADVLRSQPGIGVSNSGGPGKSTTLRIRGEESYRTLVMIDGIDVSDPTAPQVGASFDHLITTGDIQRVEILRGPQGFIYGADAGGVVNILTRTGQGGVGGEVRLEAGAFGTRRAEANVSGGNARGDFFVSIADVVTDGFNSRVADDVLRDDDGYENTTLHTKLGFNVTDSLRLQLVARDVDGRSEFDGCGFPASNDCYSDSEQTTTRVSAELARGAFTNLFSYASTDIERRDFADGNDAFSTAGEIARVEYTGSATAARTTLVYGFDFERETVAPGGAPRMERDQRAVYFEYQGAFEDRLFVTAGARYDDNDDFGEHTSVRATAAYIDAAGRGTIKYRAGIGTGFRAPSLFEIAYNAGPFAFPPASAVTLREESSAGFDVGVEIATERGRLFEVTYFDQDIEDEIYFDLTGFSGYLQSPGTSRSRGIELGTALPVGERWALLGSLTFNDTENNDGLQRIRRPDKQGSVGLQFASPGEALRFLASYRWARGAVDELFGIGRLPLDDYGVLDLSAAYAISDKLDLFGRIENAADADYEEVAGYYSAGVNAHIGMRMRF